jgi:hypothetical protein
MDRHYIRHERTMRQRICVSSASSTRTVHDGAARAGGSTTRRLVVPVLLAELNVRT